MTAHLPSDPPCREPSIRSWEYRHLRFWAGLRIAGGTALTVCGVLTLAFGGPDAKAYAWAALFLVPAALNFAYAYWQITIARSRVRPNLSPGLRRRSRSANLAESDLRLRSRDPRARPEHTRASHRGTPVRRRTARSPQAPARPCPAGRARHGRDGATSWRSPSNAQIADLT